MEKFYPTKAGLEYAALTAQGKIIEFTKGKFGDGIRSTENIAELTDLIHPLGELPISKKSVKNSKSYKYLEGFCKALNCSFNELLTIIDDENNN